MEYIAKGRPVEISATSRVSVKVKDNFYTVEATEKRAIPEVDGINMDGEYSALFDEVNKVVDTQISDILHSFK